MVGAALDDDVAGAGDGLAFFMVSMLSPFEHDAASSSNESDIVRTLKMEHLASLVRRGDF
jgi:hypothetical protein